MVNSWSFEKQIYGNVNIKMVIEGNWLIIKNQNA